MGILPKQGGGGPLFFPNQVAKKEAVLLLCVSNTGCFLYFIILIVLGQILVRMVEEKSYEKLVLWPAFQCWEQ